ncbi:MAG: hypothetical protein J6B02_05565, partial [Selenomonadales bacterium]|nr:hypothetical protein [Selenomonadales bacterium]
MVDLNKLKRNIGTLGKKASESTVIGIANGAYRLGERAFVVGKETVKLAKAVHQKDTAKQKEAAEKIVDEVVVKTAKGVVSIGKQVGKTAVSAVDCALEKNPILKDKKLHSTIVGSAAIVGTIAAGAVIGDMVEGSIAEASPDLDASALGAPDLVASSVFLPDIDINDIRGITNSTVFPNADINALAEAGMKPELIDNHIDSSLIDRSETA